MTKSILICRMQYWKHLSKCIQLAKKSSFITKDSYNVLISVVSALKYVASTPSGVLQRYSSFCTAHTTTQPVSVQWDAFISEKYTIPSENRRRFFRQMIFVLLKTRPLLSLNSYLYLRKITGKLDWLLDTQGGWR